MTPVAKLVELIENLSPGERERVEEYIAFITKEVHKSSASPFRFDWAGGLSEYRGQYSSIELQKKAMEWMSEVSR